MRNCVNWCNYDIKGFIGYFHTYIYSIDFNLYWAFYQTSGYVCLNIFQFNNDFNVHCEVIPSIAVNAYTSDFSPMLFKL